MDDIKCYRFYLSRYTDDGTAIGIIDEDYDISGDRAQLIMQRLRYMIVRRVGCVYLND